MIFIDHDTGAIRPIVQTDIMRIGGGYVALFDSDKTIIRAMDKKIFDIIPVHAMDKRYICDAFGDFFAACHGWTVTTVACQQQDITEYHFSGNEKKYIHGKPIMVRFNPNSTGFSNQSERVGSVYIIYGNGDGLEITVPDRIAPNYFEALEIIAASLGTGNKEFNKEQRVWVWHA